MVANADTATDVYEVVAEKILASPEWRAVEGMPGERTLGVEGPVRHPVVWDEDDYADYEGTPGH